MAVNIGPKISIEGDAEYNKRMKEIVEQTKTLKSEMTKLESTFDKDTSAKEKNAAKTELLTRQQENLKQRVDECRKAVDYCKDKYGENATQTLKWQQALNTAEIELAAVNNQLRDLSPAEQWKAKMEEVSTTLQTVGSKMQAAGRTLSLTVTAPLVALGTKGVKSFAAYDKTMTLATKTMGASADEADALSDAIKSAAANSVYGMSDAAEATLNFARAGLDATESANALAPAMNLAAGEGGDLDTVSAGLVATINGFGGSFDEASIYADVFANACNNSALDVNSLASSMSTAAPVFSAAGYSVNDAALYMGVMANAGIDASEAANALKSGFARLLPDAEGGKEAMEKFGWSILDSNGNMKDSVTIQNELHDSFDGLSEAEKISTAQAMFGTNQYSKWLALIETSPDDVQALSDKLDDQGTTAEMAGAMMEGFGGSMDKLKSSADVAATTLGEALAPTISTIADKIQVAVDWFNSLDESQQQMIAKVGLIVALLGPALAIGGTVISTIGGVAGALGNIGPLITNLSPMVTKITGLIGGLNPTMLLVAGGIAVAIAAGVAIYQNWDTIKEKAGQLKDAITEKFDNIKEKMSNTWETVKEKGSAAMDSIKEITGNALNTMQSEFEKNGGGIKGAQAAMMAGLQSIYTQGFAKIDGATNGALSKLKNGFSTAMSNVKSVVSDGLSRLKSAFAGSSFKFPSIKLPHFSWSWTDIGGLVKIPRISISWYAKAMQDGMILNRPTIFGASGGHLLGAGEAGSETVVGTGSLISMIRSAVAEGMGYGETNNYGGVTVNVYGAPGQDVEELADLIEERLTANVIRREAAWS